MLLVVFRRLRIESQVAGVTQMVALNQVINVDVSQFK